MDLDHFKNKNILMYNLLEDQKCLCPYKDSPDAFIEFFKTCFEEAEGDEENSQLLCINTVRLLVEIYVAQINIHHRICKEIQAFFKTLCKENIFYFMVDKYLSTYNQHLSWSFAKSLSAIFYGSPLLLSKEWITFIIKNSMLQSSDDKCFRLIELLTFIIGPGLKTSHYVNDDSKCLNVVECTLTLPKDYYICICSELAPHWNKMVDMFANPGSKEDKKEVAFLHLWKLIINGPLQDDISSIYLNKKFILDILCHGNLKKPKVVSSYVEVIIKIFSSSLKCRIWEDGDCMLVEKSVTSALSNCILESIPTNDREFCNVIRKTSSFRSLNMSDEGEEEFCAIGKKIVFILINLLAEFQNMKLLCESYKKIIAFINQKTMLVPLWLVNMFLDDDDLLFAVMLATLRIYRSIQDKNNTRTEQSAIELFLIHDINPHALFLRLLQMLGFDHNEFLSFLVSNETCCLLYLTEYLKLLLIEKDQFIKAYFMLLSDEKFSFENTAKERKHQPAIDHSKSPTDQTYSSISNSDKILMEVNLSPNIESGNKRGYVYLNNCNLVTYSSSSSDEDNSDDEEAENLLKIVSVLINLKEGIQKLVDIKEFPYNVTPLLNLLESCEYLFR